jgi:phosphate transport system protein
MRSRAPEERSTLSSKAENDMKSHYEERLDQDLDEIREKVRAVSTMIETQVRDAIHALLEDDRDLANEVIMGDRRVNRRVKEIDHLCHAFIVRYAPSARPLRFVSAALRLHVALERIGDYASTLGRESLHLTGTPPSRVGRDIEIIGRQAMKILNQALTAFNEGDVELARATYGLADETDSTLQKVQSELLRAGKKDKAPLRDIFALLRSTNLIKRVSEQAENICEQTVFAITGEERDPRVFRILFVGKRNRFASQMAVAYARQAYPESGIYSSAGWSPGSSLVPGLAEFMDSKGASLDEDATPSELRPIEEEAQHFHVIVGLSRKAERHLTEIPFRTVFLSWDLGDLVGKETLTQEEFEEMYQALTPKIQDLMQTLRGRDAS